MGAAALPGLREMGVQSLTGRPLGVATGALHASFPSPSASDESVAVRSRFPTFHR